MKKYLLALLLSVFALNVNAAIITYVHTGFGSGGIGDTTFGDAAPLAFSIPITWTRVEHLVFLSTTLQLPLILIH